MRISVLSIHTSPAAQPGQGDAGGMNVYVDQSVRALAAAGHEVDVFTADPGESTDYGGANIRLHHLPVDADGKDELADAIDELTLALLDQPSFASADLIWAHYWISAEVALRAREIRTSNSNSESVQGGGNVPGIIVSMHTIGAVKNRDSETNHERPQRLLAEERIASAADLLVANTPAERRDLIHELGADPGSVVVARPGVDHALFAPGDAQAARAELGFEPDEHIVLYVGRMQFIKGTDVVVDALARMRENNPHLASRTRGILLGAASGAKMSVPAGPGTSTGTGIAAGSGTIGTTGSSPYLRELASAIAAEPSVEVRPPVPARELVSYYRAADVLLMPSRSESFGLVAAEAAASGLPVIASAVGGLPDIVEHGCSGMLIADHNPQHWAQALERMLCDEDQRRELSTHAAARSARFDWSETVTRVLDAHAEQVARVGAASAADTGIRVELDAPMGMESPTGPSPDLVGRRC